MSQLGRRTSRAVLALLLVLTAQRAAAGPIILAGHDADDHGFTAQYAPLFTAIKANVTNGGSGILAIGADPASPAGNWITAIGALMVPPQTVTFVNNAAISSVSFAGYAILHIPSTNVDTSGGINATTENPLLTARSAAVSAFVNGGGGLFGLTQDSVVDAYGYLGPFANVQSVGVPASGDCDAGGGSQLYDNVTATPMGTSLGITNTNIDGCCWHNVFSGFAAFLQTLATANEPSCTTPVINGVPSVIGCLDCSLPGQMNLAPVLDLNPPNSQHTVTATLLESFAPNDPVVGVQVTFNVISGPNAGATGMDTTDANGQATFTYSGVGGIGVDVIEATTVYPSTTITSNPARKFWDNDCDSNLIPDTCDISCSALAGECSEWEGCGEDADVNGNSIPDVCDECTTNAGCDDGVFCNGAETCVSAACVDGPPIDCSDGVVCTSDSCNEALDACENVPDNDSCSNGLYCDGVETCDETLGCQAGSPPSCADSVVCTNDSCNEALDACEHVPDNGSCSNGLYCDGVETCDETLGCVAGSPPSCADSVVCTNDSCNEALDACENAPDNGSCSNGLYCDGAETCDQTLGCQPGFPPNCADSLACTNDSCDEATDGCAHVTDDAACDNGFFCDGPSTCDAEVGCVQGQPVVCDDQNACTSDICDESLDDCVSDDVCCGNGIVDPLEECEPIVSDEDCNNGIDDDNDGDMDCADRDSCGDPSNPNNGLETCGLDCQLDPACTDILRDPATITFGRDGEPDQFKIHGRYKLESGVNPTAEGLLLTLVNDSGAVFRVDLGPGQMRSTDGVRMSYRNREARGPDGGLYRVRLKLLQYKGAPHLSFYVIAYGDLSGFTEPGNDTQMNVGNDSAFLRRQWTPSRRGWYLKESDLY